MLRRLIASSLTAATLVAADQTNVLAPTLVTGTRLPDEQIALDQFPANATIIDRAAIDASPAATVADLLRQQVGLVPIDTVGFGQFGNVALRGFGERTGALILVDGQRVNDAGDSTLPFLWNTIPLGSIDRIEVIRGGASTTYGEGAIGGVINIITKKGTDTPITGTVSGAGGNLGYYTGHAEASGRERFFSYYASGDRQEWDGWRDSSAYRGWSAMAKPTFDTPVGQFTAGYYFHEETVENPGALTAAQYHADPRQASPNKFTFDNTIHRGSLDYSRCFDSGWVVLAKIYGQEFNTDSTSGFGTGRIEQPNVGATVQTSWYADMAGLSNRVTFGGETVQQDFSSMFRSPFGNFTTDADNWSGSLFAQDTLTILPQLDVTLGGRYDHREWDVITTFPATNVDKRADVWSYKAALTARPADQVTAWVSASRSFRLPSGFDIGAAGSVPGQLFYANPDIEPVDARTVEVGARCDRSRWLGGSLAYFYSQVRNDILFDPFTFQNENFDSRRQGVELTLTSRPRDWFDVYYTTAFTDARFDGGPYDDNRLPLVPAWQLTGGVNVRPVAGWQLTLEAVHVRDQFANNDLTNSFPENQYTLLNAKASYRWKWVTVFTAVNNLLDRPYQNYPAVTSGVQSRGFNPAPGINAQAGASVTF